MRNFKTTFFIHMIHSLQNCTDFFYQGGPILKTNNFSLLGLFFFSTFNRDLKIKYLKDVPFKKQLVFSAFLAHPGMKIIIKCSTL